VKRRIRLVTLCGCEPRDVCAESEADAPRAICGIRSSRVRAATGQTVVAVEVHARVFEHLHGTELGDDVAVDHEVAP
jgi:hypothetical protein